MDRWKELWRPLAAIGVIGVMAAFPYLRGTRVPLLGYADLGFHELGHLIGYILPISERVTAGLGSFTQIAVPLGLAIYFFWRRRDAVAGSIMTAWAGTSAWDASVYIADAPYERLPLIGGDHDWAFLLGPGELDMLQRADEIAAFVSFAGALALGLAAVISMMQPFLASRERLAALPNERSIADLPVREPVWSAQYQAHPPRGNTLPR